MNLCTGCGRKFRSVSAFDLHRTGSYYRRERKCISEAEMIQKGMVQQKNGCWSSAGPESSIVAWEKKEDEE